MKSSGLHEMLRLERKDDEPGPRPVQLRATPMNV
jgi:hypothetical protein